MFGKPEIIITGDPTQLAETAANIFATTAKNCVTQTELFTVAISGGSTPRHMHRLLAKDAYSSDMPWEKIHIFWVDERCVPVDDPASNYGLAKEDFLERIPIPLEHIHPMPGTVPPEEGAKRYQDEMEGFFQNGQEDFPVFDLIFLGMGKDGHTASLFPGAKSPSESDRWVIAVKCGSPNVYRLTLTYDVLNRAKRVYFLVSGKEKAPIVRTVLENKDAHLPAQKIQPMQGKPTWLLDNEAASLLSKEMIRDAS
ncbi:MAG: 6-phosphogluconolactonase [Desulfobacteraceae bacterium]|jgi:6-phosphogluconolactonase